MKFGHLIEYDKNVFLEKSYTNKASLNLKTGISGKQSTYVCVSRGKKCSFLGKFGVLIFLKHPF